MKDGSAQIKSYKNLSLHANHQNMCKFSGKEDDKYQAVLGVLQRWVKDLRDASEAVKPSEVSTAIDSVQRIVSSSRVSQRRFKMV